MLKKNKIVCLTIALFVLSLSAKGQYYIEGAEAASTKWLHYSSGKIRYIFPVSAKQQAEHIIAFASNDSLLKYIGCDQVRFPVIFFPNNSMSNGLVAWAPKRSELILMPPTEQYPQLFYQQLVVHEFRHIAQIQSLNKYATAVFSTVLGEHFTAAVLGLYIPPWLMEGDAVWHETRYSYSGRGRYPDYNMYVAAMLETDYRCNYNKLFLGSYKHFIPNHYYTGYVNAAYGYMKYGRQLWPEVFKYVAKRPFSITSFNMGLKYQTGLNKSKFTKEAFAYYKDQWKNKKGDTYAAYIKEEDVSDYVNYFNPHCLDDGRVLSYSTGLSKLGQFVLLDQQGTEKKLHIPGYIDNNTIVYTDSLIIYTEYTPDLRWGNVLYADVVIYDYVKKERLRLTKKKHLFVADVDEENNKLLAVENRNDGTTHLVTIDMGNGDVQAFYGLEAMNQLLQPKWVSEKEVLTFYIDQNGKGMGLVNIENGVMDTLIPSGNIDIARAQVVGDTVYFTSAWTDSRNIFAYIVSQREIKQLTNVKFGVGTFHLNGNKIIFSNYSANGFRLKSTYLDDLLWHSIDWNKKALSINYFQIDTTGNQYIYSSNSKIKNDTLNFKKYRRALRLFNFHSFMPFPSDFEGNRYFGVSFLSQNRLNTAATDIGLYKRLEDDFYTRYLKFTYSGWYPVVDIKLSDRFIYPDSSSDFKARLFTLRKNLYVPMSYSKGKWNRSLIVGANISLEYLYQEMEQRYKSWYPNVGTWLNASNIHKKAYRDIRPNLGQAIGVNYNRSLYKDKTIASSQAQLFFSGLSPHHSLLLSLGYQQQWGGDFFSKSIRLPIQYSEQADDNIRQMSRLYTSYLLPLWYPDLSLGSALYVKRVHADLFSDYVRGDRKDYWSYGAGLHMQAHFFRFVFPLELGVNFVYTPNLKKFGAHLVSFTINY